MQTTLNFSESNFLTDSSYLWIPKYEEPDNTLLRDDDLSDDKFIEYRFKEEFLHILDQLGYERVGLEIDNNTGLYFYVQHKTNPTFISAFNVVCENKYNVPTFLKIESRVFGKNWDVSEYHTKYDTNITRSEFQSLSGYFDLKNVSLLIKADINGITITVDPLSESGYSAYIGNYIRLSDDVEKDFNYINLGIELFERSTKNFGVSLAAHNGYAKAYELKVSSRESLFKSAIDNNNYIIPAYIIADFFEFENKIIGRMPHHFLVANAKNAIKRTKILTLDNQKYLVKDTFNDEIGGVVSYAILLWIYTKQ